MSRINWFPGHMHKAKKEIAAVMPQVDVVIEVCDARIPFSSENPLVRGLRGSTPLVKLLNKADLADPEVTELWVAELERERGVRALPVVATNRALARRLPALCRDVAVGRKTRALILGVPNVGKSTLINTLVGRAIARTGNEAGVTRAQQRIRAADGLMLTDTPGFLWPRLDPPSCGYRLAITGAMKDSAFDYGDVGLFAAEHLLAAHPDRLQERFGLPELPGTDLELLEAIGLRRGLRVKGGGADIQRAAALLVNELRGGKLGPITLETPEMVAAEVAEAERVAEERAREKAERARMRKLRARKNRR